MTEKPSEQKGGAQVNSTRPVFVDAENYMKSLNDKVSKLGHRALTEKFDPQKHKDTKRAQIALVFVWGYMITVVLIIIGAPLFNALLAHSNEPIDIERILSQVGSLIGAPLGFVIGYYFKEDR